MEAVEAPPRKKRQSRRDSESTPSDLLPTFRPFQLCTLATTIPTGDNWLFEMKFDGYRAQIAISGSEARVYTRNGHDWTEQFKVILPPLRTLTTGSVLLDGEIVAVDKAGRTNFSLLKSGISAGIPLKFYAFDIFEKDGADLTGLPLVERKAILEELIGDERDPGDILQYSHHVVDHGQAVFNAMAAGGHEGMIAKKADARYVGDRTTGWLKIKCTKRQEFVIGGWRPSDNGRGTASLILGTYEKGRFVYRGRVGTGFSDAMRDKILKQMEARRIEKPAFATVPRDIARQAHWVRPELVAEVAYAEITPDGSVRHASFQGMRADKIASQVVLETVFEDAAGAGLDPEMGVEIARAVGVKLSNPDKIMYPGSEITKAHLVAYYATVADKMLPHLKDRPLSLVRDTDNDLAKTFFQKHQLPGMTKTLKAGRLTKMKGTESRILWIEDLSGLVGGVQMNTLEFQVWGSDRHTPDLPERMVFDIDPDEGLDFSHVKQAANDIRDILGVIGLQSWPLVSGGKGVHVVVPLVPEADWDAVKSFCQNFAELLTKTEPHRFLANMSKARRKGRMFLDYLRNGQGSTAICPWSTRARAGGTVAVPVTWEELNGLDRANGVDIFLAAERAQGPDAWEGYFEVEQMLTKRLQDVMRQQ
ncbi:MAG: DNA ligase D [Cypionkella sp.]